MTIEQKRGKQENDPIREAEFLKNMTSTHFDIFILPLVETSTLL